MGIFALIMNALNPQPYAFPKTDYATGGGGTYPHLAAPSMAQQLRFADPGNTLQPLTIMAARTDLPPPDRAFQLSSYSRANKQIGVLGYGFNRMGWGLKGYSWRDWYGFDRRPAAIYEPGMTTQDRLPNPDLGDRNQGWIVGNFGA